MVKINNLENKNVFIFPIEYPVNIIVNNQYKDEFIDCLNSLFAGKRKSKTIILDEEENRVDEKMCNFIYIPYISNIESNFIFKSKSVFNTELTQFISQNPKQFQSIDNIRNSLYNLLTDSGMYVFTKIINMGITDKYISVSMNDFDISNMLSMLKIGIEAINKIDKFKVLYNLYLYIHRNDINIIYLDFPIDDNAIEWINYWKSESNIFLLDNECIQSTKIDQLELCAMIKLSNKDFKEEFEINISNLQSISYLFHDLVIRNMNQQSEKNKRLFDLFKNESTTFFIKFNDTNTSIYR